MSERFSFSVGRHVAVDGGVVWQQENLSDTTLNEGYVTAEEDSHTQYLSVIDTSNEISLDNLNMTLANPKLEEVEPDYITSEILDNVPEEQQVVVYTVEGSDELYGIQIAQDEEGNLQKYQFQFRKNDDGQLEAIPETIQLLPIDEDVHLENLEHLEQQEVTQIPEEDVHDQSIQIFVNDEHATEHILPDQNDVVDGEVRHQDQDNAMLYENEEIEDEVIDIKPAILTLQNIKQELLEAGAMEEETAPEYAEPVDDHLEHFAEASEEIVESGLVEYDNPLENDDDVVDEAGLRPEEEEENVEVAIDPEVYDHEINTNDSDVDDYQIVEGVHITGDVEPVEEVGDKSVQDTNNILKHALNTHKELKSKKDNNKLYLYVVQHPEKENVDALSLEMSNLCRPKVNPRSILKSSHVLMQTKNEIQTQQDEKMNKRFARCKEAVQARNFHNFINKTTIPQAPIRKDRLPRKQQIKPVERVDEEIVVQEVMVSSNRFVEMYGGAALVNKENLEVTDYVELSDSDDDYNPKKMIKKKKKHRRRKIEITISDESDSSHESVIELDESDDEPNKTPPKRSRGRPPKNQNVDDVTKTLTTNPENSPKRSRLDDVTSKPEIPCPKCDKTFPSQNSLKTHLQHHNLQTTLKNALPINPKYKCDICETVFKNSNILKSHACAKSFPCPVCRKKFPNLTNLNGHKRSHAKEQMLKSTTEVQVSPKKLKTTTMTTTTTLASKFRCKTCSKMCSSAQNLNIHMKTHKEYVCATCSKSFVSQLLLEKHLRVMCVKSPQTRQNTRNSLLPPTLRSKNIASPAMARLRRVKCDKCEAEFVNLQGLTKHQVLKHDLDIIDNKSALKAKGSVYGEHGGIPSARGLRKAFAGVSSQLDLME